MCFSAGADVVGGVVIGAVGVDVLRHLDGRRRYAPLAAMPLLLAAHQFEEAFVWWGLQGHVPATVGHVATWIYLSFAFVVLPVLVPVAILVLEPEGRRRRMMVPFVVLGVVVAGLLFAAMVRGPVVAELAPHYIAYSTDLHAGVAVVMLYVTATCGALIFSGVRNIARYGVVNLVAVALLARLTIDGFASLWCAWAAISSAAVAIHLRYETRTPISFSHVTA
ncbi:MAG: DUF6629 family protein [Ilumatobacteraceae bacterium]